MGIVVDLSHVGNKRGRCDSAFEEAGCFQPLLSDGIERLPANKPDELLKLIVDKGGFVGSASYPPFLPKGPDTTVEDCVEGIEHMVNLVGEDSVGIGNDFTQDQDPHFSTIFRMTKVMPAVWCRNVRVRV